MKRKIRLLGCGGRDWTDADMIRTVIEYYAKKYKIEVMIHGNTRGADKMIDAICGGLGILTDPTNAEWRRYRNAAGPIRNAVMLGKSPDVVLAFKDNFDLTLARGGTENMIKLANAADVDWKLFRHDGPNLMCFKDPSILTLPK